MNTRIMLSIDEFVLRNAAAYPLERGLEVLLALFQVVLLYMGICLKLGDKFITALS